MALINVERIKGIVRNGARRFEVGLSQDFNAGNTNFDQKDSRMFFEERGKFKIAQPATAFFGLFTILSRAKVVADPTRGGDKELTNRDAFVDYFKPYSGPEGTPKPAFLILEERWIELDKDAFLPDSNHLFLLLYNVEGETRRFAKVLEVKDDNKVVFGPSIFTPDNIRPLQDGTIEVTPDQNSTVLPERTSHFQLMHVPADLGKAVLMSAESPADAETFMIRIADSDILKTQLEQLTTSILERQKQKEELLAFVQKDVPEEKQNDLLERLDALLSSMNVFHESPRESLELFFQDTYGGQPDEDDLEAYLVKNFAEFHQLLQETETEE